MKQDNKHTKGIITATLDGHGAYSIENEDGVQICYVRDKANAFRITHTWNEYDTLKEAMRLLESLTPGGSEFVNDPRASADHVKEDLHWLRDTSKKLTLSHKMLSDENNQLKALCSEMLGKLKEYAEVEEWLLIEKANNILNPSKTEDNGILGTNKKS